MSLRLVLTPWHTCTGPWTAGQGPHLWVHPRDLAPKLAGLEANATGGCLWCGYDVSYETFIGIVREWAYSRVNMCTWVENMDMSKPMVVVGLESE